MRTDTQQLPALERQRDALALRLERINHETDPLVVEGFEYSDPAKATRVRGRRMCSLLRTIDDVNRDICAIIAPSFRAAPSESFTDRVMAQVGR